MSLALRGLEKTVAADLPAGVQPEDQLKPAVKAVIEAAGDRVEFFTEARIDLGRPDGVVRVRGAVCGHLELKEPGKGARPERFRGTDKAQWERFKALPNLVYSDGHDWSLFRSGELAASATVIGTDNRIASDAERQLSSLLSVYLNWEPITPTHPKALAEVLAPLCRMLRDDVATVLEKSSSALFELSSQIRSALFPDASHRSFADTYAQTLTYALLLARLSGEVELTADSAVRRLRSGHRLLSEVLQHMAHPDARSEVATAVDVLERVIAAVDPTKLSSRGDPWIYFYEHFLEAYDPKLRKDRGVYYTPAEVIKCQVHLTDQLLRNGFGKRVGYADENVVFLDPAAGTAAYPLAMIEHALNEVESAWGRGMVPNAANTLAKNVHAFEILVGPYAVAHLRISEALRSAGGRIPADGLSVYLTDTLESPNAAAASGGIFARAMTDEHRRAIRVKRDVRVLVCMGNPPYDREQAEDTGSPTPVGEKKGGWVRFGDRESQSGRVRPSGGSQASEDVTEQGILEDFLAPARAVGAGVHLKNVYNDYVYFWRWALWKLFENPRVNGPGIVSFITASSYLRGPGFVGMRRKMREAFDDLWILDLGGDNLGARKTPNVFNIQTPVAIAIGARYGEAHPETPARVLYSRLDADSREAKLDRVGSINKFEDLEWRECFREWTKPFLPQGNGDYYSWPLLTDIFPWQHSGTQFKRSWPIAETADVLERRWSQLLGGNTSQRRAWFKESRDRKIDKTYPALFPSQDRSPISTLAQNAPVPRIRRFSFRSFDRQCCLFDNRFGDFIRGDLWQTESPNQIFLTSLISGVLGEGPAASVAAYVPDLHHFRGSFGGKDVIPLWRNAACSDANVTVGLLSILETTYGEPVTAEDVFSYAYGVLATPRYVEHFSEDLSVPGPRLPLTRDFGLFRRMSEHGRALVYLHTFGERCAPSESTHGRVEQGRARLAVAIPDSSADYPSAFSYDDTTSTLHIGAGEVRPVTREVFDYSISGLHVVRSWLSYRMRERAGRSSSELDRIRPTNWTSELSRELLELIWVLEHTLERLPEVARTLDGIVAAPCLLANELPTPNEDQRRPEASDLEATTSPVQSNLTL